MSARMHHGECIMTDVEQEINVQCSSWPLKCMLVQPVLNERMKCIFSNQKITFAQISY